MQYLHSVRNVYEVPTEFDPIYIISKNELKPHQLDLLFDIAKGHTGELEVGGIKIINLNNQWEEDEENN